MNICPTCNKKYETPVEITDKKDGKKVSLCPNCGSEIKVSEVISKPVEKKVEFFSSLILYSSFFSLILTILIIYLLLILDSIVHNKLYQFGLQFSYEWANPYWLILRLGLGLLWLIIVTSSINIIYLVKKKLQLGR